MRKSKRVVLTCKGGPWKGLDVLFPQGGSMVFSVKGWHGRYDMNGRWQHVR